MTRKRDLSGFGAPAPTPSARPQVTVPDAKPTTVPPPPSARPTALVDLPPSPKPATEPGDQPLKRKKATKQRITLSLPTQVATMLRTTADTEQRIFLDIILSAFVSHADDVEAELVHERNRVGPTGGRRRAGSGRTQIPLNILREDLKVLDQRVSALNMDRSSYVTELLLRELKR